MPPPHDETHEIFKENDNASEPDKFMPRVAIISKGTTRKGTSTVIAMSKSTAEKYFDKSFIKHCTAIPTRAGFLSYKDHLIFSKIGLGEDYVVMLATTDQEREVITEKIQESFIKLINNQIVNIGCW